MTQVLKLFLIRSYTGAIFADRYDILHTRRMKESLNGEVLAFIRFLLSYCLLRFWTLLIDWVMNILVMLGIALFLTLNVYIHYFFFLFVRLF